MEASSVSLRQSGSPVELPPHAEDPRGIRHGAVRAHGESNGNSNGHVKAKVHSNVLSA